MGSRIVRGLACAAAVLTLVAACGREGGTAGDVDLEGAWHLASGRDATGPLDLAGRQVTFTVEAGRVSGTSACNLYSGTVEVRGSTLTFGGLAGTEMACEPAVMELERRYLDALAAVTRARRDDGRLTLEGPDVLLDLALTPPVPDSPLVGTPWALESLVLRDTVSSVVVGGRLLLSDDGRLEAETGCGALSGRYRLDDDRLTFTRVVVRTPDRPCDAQAEAQHDHVVAVLRGTVVARVEGAGLTLTGAADRGLDFRAG